MMEPVSPAAAAPPRPRVGKGAVEPCPAPSAPSSRIATVTLLVLCAASTWAQLWIQKAKWLSLTTEWPLDTAFFHNIVWNLRQGFGWRQTATWHERPGLWNETHFEPILALAVGPFTLVDSVDALFFTQAAVLASGAIGLFRILRAGGALPPILAATLASGWLCWWPLIRTAQADIRPLMWAAPLLVHLVAALHLRRMGEAALWALLACCCREEVPILVAAVAGLWAVRSEAAQPRKIWRHPATRLVVLSLGFLAISTALRSNTTFYIRPGEWFTSLVGPQAEGARWGHTAGELLPVRLRWLAEWILPGGAAALLAPEVLLAAGPLFLYLFSQPHEWATWEGPYIHHAAPALGLVAAAAALVAARWSRTLPGRPVLRWLGAGIFLGMLLAQSAAGLRRHTWPEIEPFRTGDPSAAAIRALAREVPADAAVMADYGTVHLLAGRRFHYCYQQEEPADVRPGPGFSGPLLPRAEADPTWALVRDDHDTWRERLMALGFVARGRGGGYTLWSRGG